jgi:hypothetical protein
MSNTSGHRMVGAANRVLWLTLALGCASCGTEVVGPSNTGGTGPASGGDGSLGTGGNSPSTGGTSGGTVTSTGGKASGGKATGGAATGGEATGGKATGGSATGGGNTGGGSSACPGANATEFATVSGWLNNTTAVGALPSYAYTNIKQNFPAGAAFNKLACSIAMSCVEWAPMETNWLRKCEAVLTSAIVAESSYNPASVVYDSYGGTTDPTVGLLQDRFSSTVHDFNYYGPMAKMAAIGCTWPSELLTQTDTSSWWKANGANYLGFMQDVACNIGLAAWYYFYNATGNGGSSAVWISNYCAGQGVAGNMVVGLVSHLQGGSYTRPADANNPYPWGIECCACGNPSGCSCTGCTGRFAAFMGIGTSASRPSPDPFQEALSPEPSKYCK